MAVSVGPVADVFAVAQVGEKLLHTRVIDRLSRVILFEILFGNIGLDGIVVHQHAVPRFVLWRTGTRHFLVPLLAALKFGIHIDDYTAIVEASMVDDLAG